MAKNNFRGGFGGMNQMQMMKQAQKMQQDLMKMQEELDQATYTATAGGGVVKATVSGKRELVSLDIDPEAVDPEDIEMLEDLIAAAVNSAVAAVDKESEEEMAKMTGGLNIPGLG